MKILYIKFLLISFKLLTDFAKTLEFFDILCYHIDKGRDNVELYEIKTDRIFYFERVERAVENKINAHYHEMLEIYYLTSGSCNFFIDDKLYHIQAGDIVFIPCGAIHKTNYESDTHSRMLINCRPECLPRCVRDSFTENTYVLRRSSVRTELDASFKRIEREYLSEAAYSDDMLLTELAYLCITAARLSSTCSASEETASCTQTAIEYIQNNYMNRVTLSETARYCSVSVEHLSRSFKRQTGVGFNEYLSLLRLKRAEELLVNQPGVSISDIAFKCGFNDSNYFSSVFKKAYGITPSQKKKQAQLDV